MAVNVGETFLQDTKKRQFHGSRQSIHFRGKVQLRLNPAALSESIHVPPSGRLKTRFIEQGGMQQIRDRSSLLQAFVNRVQAFGNKLRSRQTLSQSVHRIEIHFYDRKVLTDAVVKLAPESAPFLVLGLQQVAGEPAQRTSSFLDQAFELGIAQPQRLLRSEERR